MKIAKYLTIIFFLTGGLCSLYAQDIIYLKNGDEIEAKVMEISSAEIKYKRFDNLDGPTIVINKADAVTILYQNGTRELINPADSDGNDQSSSAGSSSGVYNPNWLTFGMYVNPSGFITFGPIIGVELIANKLDADLHFRFPTLGLLWPYMDLVESGYKNSVSRGIGVGLGVNYINNRSKGGFYVGGMFEYWFSRWEHKYSATSYRDWYSEVSAIVASANIGYKWLFPNALYLNLGAYLGASVTTSYFKGYYEQTGGGRSGEGATTIFGMLDVALGYNFVRKGR